MLIEYERVNKFYYLGDMLSAGGGPKANSITRVRTGWKQGAIATFNIQSVFT